MSEDINAMLEEITALKKENRSLNRKLKETNYLVASYEQYAVFQKNIYDSIKKQKSEQDIYLRLIFSNTPDIILVLDVAKMYILGTKKTIGHIGIDSDALTGKDFAAIFSPIMPDGWVRTLEGDLEEVLSAGEPKKYAGYAVVVQGRERSYEINIIPFRDAANQVIGAMFIMHDETELHEAALAAERSNRAKTNFLAKISHEIRTPMNAIAGMAELILREHTTGLVREHALSIKQASGNLMAIINDILDFSKIESGKLEIVEAAYQFSSLINDVISIIRMRVIDKQIFFVTNIDSDIPQTLIGDEIRIRQILLNLLSNAFKYCDRGYISIHVSCERNGDDGKCVMVFDISDSGVGIKPEDRDRLFSDFVQLDRVANRGVEGTGLGLVITKSLCEAMGGGISLYSTYGKGSTFTVRIPQRFNAYAPFAAVEEAGGKNVLIYETRVAYSSSIICSIDNLGVDCTLVSNQSKFLEELNKSCYTHVFVSSFLFESTEKIIRNLGINITLVLLAEYGDSAVNKKNVKTLEMPVHSISIANLLNGAEDTAYAENPHGNLRFIAPSAHILLVDDLMTNLRVAEGLMLPYRMQIEVCKSGAEAIELVKANIYDIVFMDHMMPEMDGVEATLAIRELEGNEYFKTLPIIALTANAVSGVKEMFLQNGFNDFLAKPIEMVKLNAILETWLPKEKQEAYVPTEDEQTAPAFEIQGIDVKAGVYMTGGNEALYLRALSAFYRDGTDKVEQLDESCKKCDMKKYAAGAHAVKGAAASIGAAKLSSFAKALELAAKSDDTEYVRRHSDIFLDEFRSLLKNISYVISTNGKNKGKAESVLFIREHLEKLRDALTGYDIESADAILSNLQSEPLDEETNGALERISNLILICEYEQALEVVNGMVNVKDGG